ncbi:MAG: hypothetical protein JXC32_14560, partial [Anaerolineae bacterium]|nr:hypothetical protein [Anaerolineae bacterium]
WRVYTPHYSPDQLVFENTWETVEDNVAFWGAYHASEAGRAFYQAWDQLVERRVSNYVWKVEVSP